MGREIRMVPPNWQHPKRTKYNPFKGIDETSFQPLFDESYSEASENWKKEFKIYYKTKQDIKNKSEFWDWDGGPPDKEFYRDFKDKEATWFCLYETVSEGTPVTPPFETKQELADYLAVNGDFWDQSRRKEGMSIMECDPWGKEAAERFVFGSGYMPSMIVMSGKVLTGGSLAAEMNKGSEDEKTTTPS